MGYIGYWGVREVFCSSKTCRSFGGLGTLGTLGLSILEDRFGQFADHHLELSPCELRYIFSKFDETTCQISFKLMECTTPNVHVQ